MWLNLICMQVLNLIKRSTSVQLCSFSNFHAALSLESETVFKKSYPNFSSLSLLLFQFQNTITCVSAWSVDIGLETKPHHNWPIVTCLSVFLFHWVPVDKLVSTIYLLSWRNLEVMIYVKNESKCCYTEWVNNLVFSQSTTMKML